jgi:hypothetical protein
MKTAFDHGQVNPTHAGNQRLFRLDPPMKNWDGSDHEWVVCSAASVLGTPEVYVFSANESGEIRNWSELDGSQRGTLDHKAPLRDLGYQVMAGK